MYLNGSIYWNSCTVIYGKYTAAFKVSTDSICVMWLLFWDWVFIGILQIPFNRSCELFQVYIQTARLSKAQGFFFLGNHIPALLIWIQLRLWWSRWRTAYGLAMATPVSRGTCASSAKELHGLLNRQAQPQHTRPQHTPPCLVAARTLQAFKGKLYLSIIVFSSASCCRSSFLPSWIVQRFFWWVVVVVVVVFVFCF